MKDQDSDVDCEVDEFTYREADAPLLCSCGGVFQRLTSAAVQAQANADLGTLVQQKTASEIIF